jgi:outer membrane protein OmpA-like peptidoglycan-associated protein
MRSHKNIAFLFIAAALGSARADTVVPGDGKKPAADKRDRDGDGVPDAIDLCPDEPEDRDGFEDEDGCPDPDNDKDRILDKDDKCPNEPETYNGYLDEDGCPDHGIVVITKCEFPIIEKIYFPSGSARLQAASRPILDAIAGTLQGNPQVKKLEIQGHTDAREAASLGQARAIAVEKYLTEHGVDPERFTSKGYGSTRPVDANRTGEGRARNRRVELFILDRDKDP